MWYINRVSKANSEFVASALELLQSTSRHLILVTGGLYLTGHYVAALTWPELFLFYGWPLPLMIGLTCVLSLWLLPKHLLIAQAVWQTGLAGSIALAFYLYQHPEILFLYMFLPLMAVVTVGRRGGLLAEGLVMLLVGWFLQGQGLPPISPGHGGVIILGGAFAGLLGWAVSRTLLTVTHWSLFSFEQARKNLEAANQHRGEVVRVMKALDLAYYNLERANHMLVLARAKAEEAQEARDRFVLAVSHELRTPLNFIFGFSELMVNSPGTYADRESWPAGLYDDIQKIYRSSIHLLQLVNDVLSLGQIEARQMALLKETVDLAQLVEEAESMIEPVLARKGLWFRTEIEPELPPVFVDCTRIRQVLLNLMTNSLRFTEEGGVTVRLQRDKEAIRVCVEDTGPGIEAEDIPKLFEEFRQVGQDSLRQREGSGLGLPISRQLVQLHGGHMWVESEGSSSQGSKFYFTLPIRGASADFFPSLDQAMVEANYRQVVTEEAKRERLLLILSADPAAGQLIVKQLPDYRVLSLNQPGQLRAIMIQHLPSAMVVDQAILKEKEVALVLQNLPYDLPVISLIFPDSLDRLKQLPTPVFNYLVKPVTRQMLAKAVLALGPHIHRLLVVDDDPAMVRFVTLALEYKAEEQGGQQGSSQAYHLATAFTGQEAMTHLRQEPPDAILLDLGLPDMTGWEILAHLQQEPELAHIPAIVITARDLPPSFHPNRHDCVQISVGRPLSWPELSHLLKQVMETIQPVYPTFSVSNGPGHPANRAE